MPEHALGACPCHDTGPRFPNVTAVREVGTDKTNGRFADVEVVRCDQCCRLWVNYLVEYEGFTGEGRWGMALIDEARALAITPERRPRLSRPAPG